MSFFNKKYPTLIAEMSANHCSNISTAKKIIKMAKINGADAIKIQSYSAESMTLNSKKKYFKITEGLWKNRYLWDLYSEGQTPYEWHQELFKYSKKIGIKIFSTPFDINAVNLLEKMNCPIYKVSSFELTDLELISTIAMTQKPMILSTGMANLDEINDAVKCAKKNGANDLTILYCVSNYPSKISDFHFNNIKIIKKKFGCRVGFSDHSINNRVCIAAVAAGAEVFEKHVALKDQGKGLDIKFSLKGKELQEYRNIINSTYDMFRKKIFYRSKTENSNKKFRRSIFAIKDIKRGEKFSNLNLKIVRPNIGLEPKFLKFLLNKKSPYKIHKHSPIKKNILLKLKKK